jgi:hypothetical protein
MMRIVVKSERAASGYVPAAEGGEMTQEKQEKVWEPMKLTYVGDVGEIIQNAGGQGKSSTSADSGDVHKPPGQG